MILFCIGCAAQVWFVDWSSLKIDSLCLFAQAWFLRVFVSVPCSVFFLKIDSLCLPHALHLSTLLSLSL
jgi:hypothetical protein